MSVPNNPHDSLFRALLEDPQRARALIRDYLPAEITAQLADASPEPMEGSFVDDALRGSQSDRLFRVQLVSGRPAYIYTLLEHKSAPDTRTPVQLLGYMARIWQRHITETGGDAARRLPPIIPLVVYHGQAPWTVPTAVADCIEADDALRPYLSDFRYVLAETREVPYDDLASDRALRAGLAALTYAFGREVTVGILARLLGDLPDREPIEQQVLEYVAAVYNMEEHRLTEAARQAKPERQEDLMSTVAEQWMQRSKAETVIEALEERFGPIDPARRQKVMNMTSEELSRLNRRAIKAQTLDDAFADDADR
jgi:predicted transposase/invertase (TIGR01784 family)